jgi:pre-rRNA-processing protein TSR2
MASSSQLQSQTELPSAGKPVINHPSNTKARKSQLANVPILEIRRLNFEGGVALTLALWPALTLAVQEGWGGPDSDDKRDWFAGAVAELFPELKDQPPNASMKKEAPEGPDIETVETRLLQVMLDEFEVNIQDDSGFEVAEQILRLWVQCCQGRFTEVEELRSRWNARKGHKAAQMFKKGEEQDQDTDWDTEDESSEDGDVDMDEAPPLEQVPKEKPAPEVDEDGFTKVTRRKR